MISPVKEEPKGNNLIIELAVIDLPEPLSPIIPKISPALPSKLNPFRISFS